MPVIGVSVESMCSFQFEEEHAGKSFVADITGRLMDTSDDINAVGIRVCVFQAHPFIDISSKQEIDFAGWVKEMIDRKVPESNAKS